MYWQATFDKVQPNIFNLCSDLIDASDSFNNTLNRIRDDLEWVEYISGLEKAIKTGGNYADPIPGTIVQDKDADIYQQGTDSDERLVVTP